ncbi:MAG: hypothetical protein HYR64_03950 [Fimbriimonas ginsengisoli]|uniref:Organic solvent tolerance-like N-terminal domain-containing protein n=1 Tax=Fimbriimonas ginsengisoli TaxID=1005039 RepID=A0A931LU85_FIMGI|nr:hypothetical protein [Fimbriimonas ginsengisoli]
MKSTLFLAFLGATAVAFAQTRINFSDKSGNMTIRNFTSWSSRMGDKDHMHFKGAGKPLHGTWKEENVEVDCQQMEGDAQRLEGKFRLTHAVLTGSVKVVQIKGAQTVTSWSDTAVIDREGEVTRIELTGRSRMESQGPGKGESSSAKGDLGALVVGEQGLRTATLTGNVSLQMKRVGSDGQPLTLDGKCRRLDADLVSSPATLTLSGEVVLTGNNPAMAGDAHADKAVITLDADRQPVGIDLTGEPGQTRYSERGKG